MLERGHRKFGENPIKIDKIAFRALPSSTKKGYLRTPFEAIKITWKNSRMGKKLLQHAQKWENSPGMGTKIGASSELLIVEFLRLGG